MWKLLLLVHTIFMGKLGSLRCPTHSSASLRFHLVRECQRAAADDALALESTATLQDCMQLARELRGLALNYAPGGPKRRTNLFAQQPRNESERRQHKDARRGLSVFQQPAEYFNCHVLQCPQNTSFAGMVNDSRFDYYSLYGRPTALNTISCVPQVGLFVLYTEPSRYLNASLSCSNASEYSGSLAHIASESRTYGLSRWLRDYNTQGATQQSEPGIFLAYVGLHYNGSQSMKELDFRNAQQESLLCFLYSAWHVGHPRLGGAHTNSSCVALTPQGSWQTVSCEHKLPFICEIFAPNSSVKTQLETGANAADSCVNDLSCC